MENKNIIQSPTPAPIIEQTPPVSPTSPKTPNKLMIFVILFIVIVAVGIGTYVLGVKTQTNTVIPTPGAVTQATPTPDPTADWKTYTNNKLGFSLKYPIDWEISSSSDTNVDFSRKISTEEAKLKNLPASGNISIMDVSTDSAFLPNDVKTNSDPTNMTVVTENTNVSSTQATKYIVTYKKSLRPGINPGDGVTYVLLHAKTDFVFLLRDNNYRNIFDQILSTFKFD